MIFWSRPGRGKTVGTAACCVVYDSCAHRYTHTHTSVTDSYISLSSSPSFYPHDTVLLRHQLSCRSASVSVSQVTVLSNGWTNRTSFGQKASFDPRPVDHQLQSIPQASTGRATEQAMGARMADCLHLRASLHILTTVGI